MVLILGTFALSHRAGCLYVLREKCTGVQKNSAFGALCEASGAFPICGANISGRRYFARCAEMNFMEKGPAEKQVLFLVDLGGPNKNLWCFAGGIAAITFL